MNYHKITKCDIANGEGVRVTLWVSGCNHHCKGCHNPQTWDENSGKPFTIDTLYELIDVLNFEYIDGLTLSGGDPLFPDNREQVLEILSAFRVAFGKTKSVWCYTGYSWEEVKDLPHMRYIDVLVDGEFKEDEKDISLPFCGSRNQRVIDVQKSLNKGEVVLYESVESKT